MKAAPGPPRRRPQLGHVTFLPTGPAAAQQPASVKGRRTHKPSPCWSGRASRHRVPASHLSHVSVVGAAWPPFSPEPSGPLSPSSPLQDEVTALAPPPGPGQAAKGQSPRWRRVGQHPSPPAQEPRHRACPRGVPRPHPRSRRGPKGPERWAGSHRRGPLDREDGRAGPARSREPEGCRGPADGAAPAAASRTRTPASRPLTVWPEKNKGKFPSL